MSKNVSDTAEVEQVLSTADAVADDWENIGGDQVQQLTNERLSLAVQQQQSNVVEQQVLNEQPATDEVGLPASMINKPIKLLKREQPIRKRQSESETDEAALLDKLSLDQRKANYDKIRERIFNTGVLEDGGKKLNDEKKKSPRKATATEIEASTSSEIMIETINHLSNVQMLSEQTPHRVRPQVMPPPPPPLWIPPHDIRAVPPIRFMSSNISQPPLGLYGMPPPQPMPFVPPDFSRPPPSFGQGGKFQGARNKFNP